MTKTELKQIIEKNMRGVKSDYDYYTSASFEWAVKNTRAGEKLPERGVFHEDIFRGEYNEAVKQKKHETMEAVKTYLDGLSKKAAAVPSPEALRAVQMFSMLDPGSMTKTEYARRIDSMMKEYGKDAITYETLRSMAGKADIHGYPVHKDIAVMEAADSLVTNVQSFFDKAVSTGNMHDKGPTDVSISFTLGFIDSAIDTTE